MSNLRGVLLPIMCARFNLDFEVAIIGASLAGTAFALQFADRGRSIALIDKEQFPRRKPCGEGLSNPGVEMVKALGVEIDKLPHQEIRKYRIDGNGSENCHSIIRPDQAAGGGIGIRRDLLDSVMLEKCQSQTASRLDCLMGSGVESVRQTRSHCEILLRNGRKLRSCFAVIASGANTRWNKPSAANGLPQRFAYTRQFQVDSKQSLSPEVRIILMPQCEAYLTPVSDSELNLAVLCPRTNFSRVYHPEAQEKLRRILEERLQLDLVPKGTSTATGPLGNRRRASCEGRFYFAGDACEQFDPIGGMGMTHALASGALAAESIASILLGLSTREEAARTYERSRNRAARPLRGFTRLTYLTLVSMNSSPAAQILRSSKLAEHASRAIHRTDSRLLTTFSSAIITLAGI